MFSFVLINYLEQIIQTLFLCRRTCTIQLKVMALINYKLHDKKFVEDNKKPTLSSPGHQCHFALKLVVHFVK